MKHGKRPTRSHKILMSKYRLNCDNWLVIGEDNNAVTLIHRHTNTKKVILK